ncbi:hypothetical protein BHYA_0062g00340 [Botrytis hyacinthi]|uniref:Uncharacterized protein n=1 Tax=Botrytis hyacinthi TaxID=278943 RepID=A0A4Z1GUT7_9HELO|nr:hypothetical protein BHYA_0062g00340 [Botrytis hyacinthi]
MAHNGSTRKLDTGKRFVAYSYGAGFPGFMVGEHKAKGSSTDQLTLIRDPDLTAEGRSDCQIFSNNFSDSRYVTHIWCSPMTRTIRTALLCFQSAIARGVKVEPLDILQNWDTSPNSIGMDKEDLYKHFGEQVDFEKLAEGWNDKSSSKWAPKNRNLNIAAIKLALNGLRSTTTNMIEVVIISHGSVLKEMTNGKGGWRSGKVRSYLIGDTGETWLLLDKSDLEARRCYPLNQNMIPTLDRVQPEPLDPSILVDTLTHKHSESFEKAPEVKIKVVIQIVAKNTSKKTEEEILKTSKRYETRLDALFKLLQEELPPTNVEGGGNEDVKARPIIGSKQRPITTQASKIPIAIWRIEDHDIARKTPLKVASARRILSMNHSGILRKSCKLCLGPTDTSTSEKMVVGKYECRKRLKTDSIMR